MRKLVWFSCGAASAVAAKMAVDKYPDCEVLYCDTLAYEHPDNMRFLNDVAKWIGKEIKLLKFLFKQEMAVGIILNPVLIEFLEFDECIIRWN